MLQEGNGTFLDFFDDLDDPRSDKNKLYSIHEILLVVICGMICEAESWRDFVTFGHEKLDFLREYLPFVNGIPSKNTFCRFFASLKPEQFKICFIEWVKSLPQMKDDIVAIDGKHVCNSFVLEKDKSAIHMVSAFASKTKLVLAQQKVDDKSNEITAIPKLLNLLDIKGKIVTIDAMGTQKEIAKQIVDAGGDYILALKGNHSTLHNDIVDFFKDNLLQANKNFNIDTAVDCGHGRIEERTCYTTDQIDWLGDLRFSGMRSIVCIDAKRTIGEVTSHEKRYYISSLMPEANRINMATREHWTIENCLHWSLDVTFSEDNCRIHSDNAAENIAMVRHTALNLLQVAKAKYKGSSLKGLRKKAAWGNSTLKTILAQ